MLKKTMALKKRGVSWNFKSFQIIRPRFPIFEVDFSRHLTHNVFQEAHDDITTGVTRRYLTGVDGERAGNDTTRPATQVGPRTVEAGLGGHDDGASGVDEGAGNASIPL